VDKLKFADGKVSLAQGRLIVDIPDTISPNDILTGIVSSGGSVLSVIPRRKRLEDLFVETVTKKPLATEETQ
jgi:ABC-2 type transport system ATP-binding protein